ncbi:lipocalin family protein [Massilia sp. DWR3-1-1]|uniref:lipocalin family protein n=1 Tax=Massilia sp. DWR3-1-1 TaxID=2804559 RepID=UPI003CF8A795
MKHLCIALLGVSLLAGCVSKPANVTPVTPFDSARYLGKWYEIARLDNRFERGLEHITADYSMRPDGGIKVLNRGLDVAKKEWKQAEGKAYFVEGTDAAYLKVSFFGPFYASYIVFDLDPAYQVSMVSGADKSYLWILSRTPTIDAATRARLVQKAKSLGFETDKLITVDQSAP